eukprot:1104997-Amphidinium_carterae.1
MLRCEPRLPSISRHLQIHWMRAHLSDRDAAKGRVPPDDLDGNEQADLVAVVGTGFSCRPPLGPELRDRPENWSRVTFRLPTLNQSPLLSCRRRFCLQPFSR